MPAWAKPGAARPILIAGTRYESCTAAARIRRQSTETIYKMLRDGRARYEAK